MKIKCPKSSLLNGVSIVSKAVPNKTTMSILECILINANDGQIKLTANDMELGIETVIEGEIIESGIIALDAKILFEIIRKLPDSEVTISSDDSFKTSITCEKANFNIIGKSGEDFSFLPTIEKNDYIMISQYSLKEVIRQTIFSIDETDSNKMMGGELFEINNDTLRVVSLDGHRISIRNIYLKNSYPSNKVIVPGKTLSEISKILSGDAEKDVYIYFTNNHILFEFDDTIVVSRLIEGEYFNINQMITTDYETKVTINKKEFYDCIDRATLLIKEGNKKPVIITIGDENMELKINSTVGSMDEQISIQKEGKDIMIGFNPKFLIDALKVIEDEEIDIYMVNPKAPCFIRDEENNYVYLILPVNFTTVS
ncbi:MAG: DNA polymerase III subunit beta [Bacilli bacterium]|nr:DNA polymerase III subunit beta [Bacilli bacterium]